MMPDLPVEITSLIAGYVATFEIPLTPYSLVSRAWQSGFESEIYSSLLVISPSDKTEITVGRHAVFPKKGLTLDKLDELIKKYDRRRAIRELHYRVAVPHWISDGLREKDWDDDLWNNDDERVQIDDSRRERNVESFSYDNPIRNENDETFSAGVKMLFEYLSSWQGPSISLALSLQAEYVYTSDQDTVPFAYLSTGIGDMIAAYRAQFTIDSELARVTCVSSIEFPGGEAPCAMGAENNISGPAGLKIASACIGLPTFCVDFSDTFSTNEPERRAEHRNLIIDGLYRLLRTIRELDLIWDPPDDQQKEHDSCTMPRPTVPAHSDKLSHVLHEVSLGLEELYIFGLDLSSDIFAPLDVNLPVRRTWESMKFLQFMPNLEEMWISHFRHCRQSLEFKKTGDGCHVLTFDSFYCYIPSYGVLRSWKADGEFLIRRGWLETEYARWPPAS